MVSRNKDNVGLEGFKPRNKTFVSSKTKEELMSDFNHFASMGVEGEKSRLYETVNSRKMNFVRKSLQHYLVDHEELDREKVESLVASLAAKEGSRDTRKFLFDADLASTEELNLFVLDLFFFSKLREAEVEVYKTPNGFGVVTDRGFDTRDLLEKWSDVSLHRDGMRFLSMFENL